MILVIMHSFKKLGLSYFKRASIGFFNNLINWNWKLINNNWQSITLVSILWLAR